jgi:hypothetical protein
LQAPQGSDSAFGRNDNAAGTAEGEGIHSFLDYEGKEEFEDDFDDDNAADDDDDDDYGYLDLSQTTPSHGGAMQLLGPVDEATLLELPLALQLEVRRQLAFEQQAASAEAAAFAAAADASVAPNAVPAAAAAADDAATAAVSVTDAFRSSRRNIGSNSSVSGVEVLRWPRAPSSPPSPPAAPGVRKRALEARHSSLSHSGLDATVVADTTTQGSKAANAKVFQGGIRSGDVDEATLLELPRDVQAEVRRQMLLEATASRGGSAAATQPCFRPATKGSIGGFFTSRSPPNPSQNL